MKGFGKPPVHRWLYPCRIERVIDGDTLIVLMDGGFHTYLRRRVRLSGINCPELMAEDPQPGRAALAFTQDWYTGIPQPEGTFPFLLESNQYDAYGRTLGAIWRAGGYCLNQDLLTAGHAVPMKG